jgi:hypothetical protein
MVLDRPTREILEEIEQQGFSDIIGVFKRGRQITQNGRVKAMNVLIFGGRVRIEDLTTSFNPYTDQEIKIWRLREL